MAIQIAEIQVNVNKGDSIWDLLRSNVTGLHYTENELDRNPELFVWILWRNAIVNFRNVLPATITLPDHKSLADLITLVKSDSKTYDKKYFEWVEMDRCAART
jgi:hypothetical protein